MSGFGKKLKRFIESIESRPEISGDIREREIADILKRLPTQYIYSFQMALAIEVLQRLVEAQGASSNLRAAAKKVLEADN